MSDAVENERGAPASSETASCAPDAAARTSAGAPFVAESVAPATSASSATAAPSTRKPRYGDELALVLEAFDERGRAHGRCGEYHVTVSRGVVGARVRVQVLRRRRDEVEARVVELLERSPHAVEPRCAHAHACGGCPLQSLAYERQLAGLEALVREPFAALGLLNGVELRPIEPARELYAYRNKMEFSFGSRRWIDPSEPADLDAASTSFALGLHAAELYSKVIDVRRCEIQPEVANAILAHARAIALEHGLSPWDVRAHTGLLRHLVIRVARSTGEVLVNLVTSSDSHALVDAFARELLAREPRITTLVQNVNTRAAQTAFGERERVLHGRGRIVERVSGLAFEISANSFFQTNTAQAERLFTIVREECALRGGERVFDLYCGTGALGLALAGGAADAHVAAEIVGFEQVSSAVADARINARLNGLERARFVEGDVLTSLASRSSDGAREIPDLCVVDPPRAGLHPSVPASIAALGAAKLVYVSCNPRAAARDAAALAALGYALERVRPIDLFPHTPHVESVLTFRRGS